MQDSMTIARLSQYFFFWGGRDVREEGSLSEISRPSRQQEKFGWFSPTHSPCGCSSVITRDSSELFLQIHSWKDLVSPTNIMSTSSDLKQRDFGMHVLLELMYESFKNTFPSTQL